MHISATKDYTGPRMTETMRQGLLAEYQRQLEVTEARIRAIDGEIRATTAALEEARAALPAAREADGFTVTGRDGRKVYLTGEATIKVSKEEMKLSKKLKGLRDVRRILEAEQNTIDRRIKRAQRGIPEAEETIIETWGNRAYYVGGGGRLDYGQVSAVEIQKDVKKPGGTWGRVLGAHNRLFGDI